MREGLGLNNSNIVLVGAPVEEGTGRRGCVMGPDAFRTAGISEELQALGHSVADFGNLACEPVQNITSPSSHLKNFERIAGWTKSLHGCSYDLAGTDRFPVYLGGDHSIALGTLTGHARRAKEQDRPLFVLWLDAHSDFNTFETTRSGNLHGTPLALACGLPGYETLMGHPLPAAVDPQNVLILGVRSIDRAERELLKCNGVNVEDMRSVDEHGMVHLLAPFLETVKSAGGLLHVSLDVDFLDPEFAPAVGTTVPGGATFREAHLVMELLHDSGLVTSLDLVELNPFLDNRGQTARLMVDLTASLFGRRVFDRPTRSY